MLVTLFRLHIKSRIWLENVANMSINARSFYATLLNIVTKWKYYFKFRMKLKIKSFNHYQCRPQQNCEHYMSISTTKDIFQLEVHYYLAKDLQWLESRLQQSSSIQMSSCCSSQRRVQNAGDICFSHERIIWFLWNSVTLFEKNTKPPFIWTSPLIKIPIIKC